MIAPDNPVLENLEDEKAQPYQEINFAECSRPA
jgi:hypothetical protein